MKLYQYDDLKKTNQALGSFKRNEVPVEEVKLVVVEGKVQFFIVADPPYTPRPEGEDKPKKKADKEPKAEEKKVEKKAEEKKEKEKKPEKKDKTKKKKEEKKK